MVVFAHANMPMYLRMHVNIHNNLKNKHAHKATRDDDGDSSDNSEPSKPETWEGITILGVIKRHL